MSDRRARETEPLNFNQWPGHEFHKGGSGVWYRKLKGCETWDYLAKAEAGRRWIWKASRYRHPRLSDPYFTMEDHESPNT